jgi:hypothetical protein
MYITLKSIEKGKVGDFDRYLSVKNLESLYLCDVSWNTLPPLGDLGFIGDPDEKCKGLVSSQSFQSLKRIELVNIPSLTKWVGNGKCHLFSLLEVVTVEDCPELVELPFSHPICRQAKQDENMTWFPKLRVLNILDCPKLASLPSIPWKAPCSADICRAGSGFERLVYSGNDESRLFMYSEVEDGLHSACFNGLAFHNLANLTVLDMDNCPPLPLIHLQKLKSLKTLTVFSMSSIVLLLSEDQSHSVGWSLPVERLRMSYCDANGEELTHLLTYFPKLTELDITRCQKITGLGVVEHRTGNESEHAQAAHSHQQTRGEDEVASTGLLLLPSQLQLQTLHIDSCDELRLLPNALGNDNARGGLQSLCSLHSLNISFCPKFLSSYSSSASSRFPFPNSLQNLSLGDVEGMETLDCLSNLVSLNCLRVTRCPNLRSEGLWPLVGKIHLAELFVYGIPNIFTGLELLLPHGEEPPKLKSLQTDDLAGVLTLPICSLLSSSLTELRFWDSEVERFTKEQEDALHLLNSLQDLEIFTCRKLQRLPAGLTKLTTLKRLRIYGCTEIRLLPKDGLPNSLRELVIHDCPTIKSLPKDGLPSSLRELHLRGKISEKLKRQCRKLRGTIPIIKDYE